MRRRSTQRASRIHDAALTVLVCACGVSISNGAIGEAASFEDVFDHLVKEEKQDCDAVGKMDMDALTNFRTGFILSHGRLGDQKQQVDESQKLHDHLLENEQSSRKEVDALKHGAHDVSERDAKIIQNIEILKREIQPLQTASDGIAKRLAELSEGERGPLLSLKSDFDKELRKRREQLAALEKSLEAPNSARRTALAEAEERLRNAEKAARIAGDELRTRQRDLMAGELWYQAMLGCIASRKTELEGGGAKAGPQPTATNPAREQVGSLPFAMAALRKSVWRGTWNWVCTEPDKTERAENGQARFDFFRDAGVDRLDIDLLRWGSDFEHYASNDRVLQLRVNLGPTGEASFKNSRGTEKWDGTGGFDLAQMTDGSARPVGDGTFRSWHEYGDGKPYGERCEGHWHLPRD